MQDPFKQDPFKQDPNVELESFKKSNTAELRAFAISYQAYADNPCPANSIAISYKNTWTTHRFIIPMMQKLEEYSIYRNLLQITIDLIEAGMLNHELVKDVFAKIDPQKLYSILKKNGISKLSSIKAICVSNKLDLTFGWEQNKSYNCYKRSFRNSAFIHNNCTEDDLSLTESLILDLNPDDTSNLLRSLKSYFLIHASIAHFRPEKYKHYLDSIIEKKIGPLYSKWELIISVSEDFDQQLISYAKKCETNEQLYIYTLIDHYRPDTCKELAIQTALKVEYFSSHATHALHYLCETSPLEANNFLYHLISTSRTSDENISNDAIPLALSHAAALWKSVELDPFAELLLPTMLRSGLWGGRYRYQATICIAFEQLLKNIAISPNDLKKWHQSAVHLINNTDFKTSDKNELINRLDVNISYHRSEVFEDHLWKILQHKNKSTRDCAILALTRLYKPPILPKIEQLLTLKTMNSRIGAIELLASIEEGTPDTSVLPTITKAYTNETSSKVKAIILKKLKSLGHEGISEKIESPNNLKTLLNTLDQQAKSIKLPKSDWLDLSILPKLIDTSGKELPELFIIYMLQHQAQHKTIEVSAIITPILSFIDRTKSHPFAMALLTQWLESPQDVKGKWALTLAGLLGNDKIIDVLEPRIDPWCLNSRHKLAEYSAQAIALLASETSLMVLDSLRNKYSRKFKNIGKACSAAFHTAAAARGVHPDELADMIVPTLEFNDEGIRTFETVDTPVSAVLQPDFKLTWLNTKTGKETKTPPASLSVEAKAEIKYLRKTLRTVIKAQDSRLEQSLITQRRWPVRRWQELFENNPLLQRYATRLIWGVYDQHNKLLRSFRRYDNGILATGGGEMEDLEEDSTQIGILHPLELKESVIEEWSAHIGRFKIKPPFSQLKRPIERCNPDHGNRRQINFTDGISISAGTLLSRSTKHHWSKGSVEDGGAVFSIYKTFPGAGIEISLETHQFWVAIDPTHEVQLGKAYFTKIDSIDRGNYAYDDPQPEDPRVLTFSDIPTIVYSEAISDLKAIIEGQI